MDIIDIIIVIIGIAIIAILTVPPTEKLAEWLGKKISVCIHKK